MSNQLLIESLEREIAQEEAATEEKRITVRVLKRREAEARAAAARTAEAPTAAASGPTSPPATTVKHETFTDLVLKAIGELGGREFVGTDVYNILLRYGAALPDDPKSKIPTVLSRYVGKGQLTQTFKGGGNVPNRYRITSAFQTNGGEKG